MTRWIGVCAVAATLLSSFGAHAATPAARGSQAQQTKAPTKSVSKAAAKPAKAPKLETHRVFTGQTLGMIAKRYNVSIDALCNANGITRKDKIQPGQKLFVPSRADKDGSEARRIVLGEPEPTTPPLDAPSAPRKVNSENIAASTKAASSGGVDARGFPKVVPARAALPTRGTLAKGKKGPSWAKYTKAAPKKGYVVLNATGRNWKGYAIVKGNRLSSNAQGGFNHALYSWRTGKENTISPSLIRLLAQVSDVFGGRPLRVVSGYREHSHAKESRHKLGHACDFSIVGVPNEVLRDYLLTLDGVGVGYYPNSSFVHLDVRRIKTIWVDFSGPGQRPRYMHERTRRPAPSKVPAEIDFSRVPAPIAPDADTEAPTPAPLNPGWAEADSMHPPLLAATFGGELPAATASGNATTAALGGPRATGGSTAPAATPEANSAPAAKAPPSVASPPAPNGASARASNAAQTPAR